MSVWTSISLTLAASAAMNLGLVLLKRGLPPLAANEAGQPLLRRIRRVRRSPAWYAGLGLLIGGYVVYGVAVGAPAAAISLLQPLFASGILVVALTAVLYLRERFTSWEWIGIALLVTGVVLVGASAEPSPSRGSIEFGRLAVFGSAVGLVLVLLLLLSQIPGARVELLYSFLAGIFLAVGYFMTKVMTVLFHGHQRLLGALACGLMVFGLVAGFIVLQMAFRRGRVLIVTAINLVTNQVVVISGGLVCLGEQFPRTPILFWSRIGGLAAIGAGVVLLARVSSGTGHGDAVGPAASLPQRTSQSVPA